MTDTVFYTDTYAKECTAQVTQLTDTGIVLDRTVFYPTGGGQPGDSGELTTADGRSARIVSAQKLGSAIEHLVLSLIHIS